MRLISYLDDAGDRLGLQHEDGRIWSAGALGAELPSSMADLLAGGSRALSDLADAARSAAAADRPGDVAPARRIAPVPRPGKIVAVGLNYRDHAEEGGAAAPPEKPMLFAKFPTSVIGPDATVEWDPRLTQEVDLEVELGIVIGRTARRVDEADALDYVLGYTCINDVSARDLQMADKQFVRGKSLDTFCPMGPAVVTADELGAASDLGIRSFIDERPMQDSNTALLIHDVAALVSFCSQAFTLEPGDVIASGTPSGVGYFREPRVSLHDGETVHVEIDRIGRLSNPCRELSAD